MQPFPESIPAAELLAEIRAGGPPSLGPAGPRPGRWRSRLGELSDTDLLGAARIKDPDAAACVRSGLLLLGDDLDGSHSVSQSVHTSDGSFWHGIMHRREPDYSNSKYWFRRVGDHPVFGELAGRVASLPAVAAEMPGGRHDPFRFVDLVEACLRGGREDLEEELLQLQEAEMLTLLAHCHRRALGS